MSADKYAQFIAEQQRKLSVSGVNAVDLQEKKHMTKADIAGLKEPKDKIDADDLEALRNKEHLKKEEVDYRKAFSAANAGNEDKFHELMGVTDDMPKNHPTYAKSKKMYTKLRSMPGDSTIADAMKAMKEEVEQIDELTGKGKLAGMKKHYDTQAKKYGEYKDSDLEYEDPEDYQDKMMQHAAHKDASKRAGAMMKLAAAKKKGKPSEVSKAKAQFKKTSADKQYIVREPFKEEAEQIDEWGNKIPGISGKHASQISPKGNPKGRIGFKGRIGATPVQKLKKLNNSFDISDVELEMIEEALKKGDLPDVISHYKNHDRMHSKLSDKHAALAARAEELGDEDGWEHHYGKSIEHDHEAQRARLKIDHAVSLTAKVKARKQMKDAQAAVMNAGKAKRDFG
jgi:hypothetical protein